MQNVGMSWLPYLVGIDMPLQVYGQKPPFASGVYFLFAADGGMLYVGRAADIDYRLFQHRKSGKDFQMFGCIEVPDHMVRGVESAYIEALDPCLNFKRESGMTDWQPAMVAAIREKWAHVERLDGPET